jgi:hypothetical protein
MTTRVVGPVRVVMQEIVLEGGLRLTTGSTATITARPYWMSRGGVVSGQTALEFFFFDELATRLALAGVTATVRAAPGAEGAPGASRIEIARTTASAWGIDWDHPDSTLDPRLLGFPADVSGTSSSDAGGVMRPPMSYRGAWISRTQTSQGRPRISRRIPYVHRRWPNERRPWLAPPIITDRFDLRVLAWPGVPAAAVLKGLATDPPRARAAGMVLGDDHQTFEEVWERLGDGQTMLLCHDHEEVDGLTIPTGRWERVSLGSTDTTESLDQAIGPGRHHDTYECQLVVYVSEGAHVY